MIPTPSPGDLLPELPGPDITLDRIRSVMTVMADTNPIHVNEDLVRRLGMRGPVNQGPSNLGYLVNMLTRWSGDEQALTRLRVRFQRTVIPGDRVVAGGRVIAVTEEGCAECEVWLRSNDGETMLSGTASVRFVRPDDHQEPS